MVVTKVVGESKPFCQRFDSLTNKQKIIVIIVIVGVSGSQLLYIGQACWTPEPRRNITRRVLVAFSSFVYKHTVKALSCSGVVLIVVPRKRSTMW